MTDCHSYFRVKTQQ